MEVPLCRPDWLDHRPLVTDSVKPLSAPERWERGWAWKLQPSNHVVWFFEWPSPLTLSRPLLQWVISLAYKRQSIPRALEALCWNGEQKPNICILLCHSDSFMMGQSLFNSGFAQQGRMDMVGGEKASPQACSFLWGAVSTFLRPFLKEVC